jgi:hypothetical protein
MGRLTRLQWLIVAFLGLGSRVAPREKIRSSIDAKERIAR